MSSLSGTRAAQQAHRSDAMTPAGGHDLRNAWVVTVQGAVHALRVQCFRLLLTFDGTNAIRQH